MSECFFRRQRELGVSSTEFCHNLPAELRLTSWKPAHPKPPPAEPGCPTASKRTQVIQIEDVTKPSSGHRTGRGTSR